MIAPLQGKLEPISVYLHYVHVLSLLEKSAMFNMFLNQKSTLYLWPNIRVDRVSCSLKEDGEQQIIMVVLALPPEIKIQSKEYNFL